MRITTIIVSLALLCLPFNACKTNPCNKVKCMNGMTKKTGSTCQCNCAAGYEGVDCAQDAAEKFLGGDVEVTEKWKIAGTYYTGYINRLEENHRPSNTYVIYHFMHDNVYYDNDSATVTGTNMTLSAVPVQILVNGTSHFYTYTGQGVKAGDSAAVNGALMEGNTFVDSIRLVYTY